MKTVLLPVLATLAGLTRSRAILPLEILALRQQLAMVAERDRRRFHVRRRERVFWVLLYRFWPASVLTLQLFKPNTLVRWHRKGFRLYWTWKSRRRHGGRPPIDFEVRRTHPDDVPRQGGLGRIAVDREGAYLKRFPGYASRATIDEIRSAHASSAARRSSR